MTDPRKPSALTRFNLWLANRVWIPIAALVMSVVLLGVALLIVTARVNDNSTKLSELRYRSCIEDAVLDFKVAEGDVVVAAFSRDTDVVTRLLPPYRDALEQLRGAQETCRNKFPDLGG